MKHAHLHYQPVNLHLYSKTKITAILVVFMVAAAFGSIYFAIKKHAAEFRANLLLATLSNNPGVGETITLPLVLEPLGAPVYGVDLDLNFSKTSLTFIGTSFPSQATSLQTIMPSDNGRALNSSQISLFNQNGNIKFSLLAGNPQTQQPNPAITTTANIILLQFRRLTADEAWIKFNFVKGTTTESNVALASAPSQDILDQVNQFNLKALSSTTTSSSSIVNASPSPLPATLTKAQAQKMLGQYWDLFIKYFPDFAAKLK